MKLLLTILLLISSTYVNATETDFSVKEGWSIINNTVSEGKNEQAYIFCNYKFEKKSAEIKEKGDEFIADNIAEDTVFKAMFEEMFFTYYVDIEEAYHSENYNEEVRVFFNEPILSRGFCSTPMFRSMMEQVITRVNFILEFR